MLSDNTGRKQITPEKSKTKTKIADKTTTKAIISKIRGVGVTITILQANRTFEIMWVLGEFEYGVLLKGRKKTKLRSRDDLSN